MAGTMKADSQARRSNRFTNALHKRLPVALRLRVEAALRHQGPGQATYQQVYDRFKLAAHGISRRSLERYGKRVRDAAQAGGPAENGLFRALVTLAEVIDFGKLADVCREIDRAYSPRHRGRG